MAKATSSAPSQRMLRVGEQVRAALTQILQRGEVRDDLIESTVISISEVRMSPDLKIATAYVTPLGVADHTDIITALNRHADTSFDNYQKIDALLRSPEVQRDLGPSNEKDDEQN